MYFVNLCKGHSNINLSIRPSVFAVKDRRVPPQTNNLNFVLLYFKALRSPVTQEPQILRIIPHNLEKLKKKKSI